LRRQFASLNVFACFAPPAADVHPAGCSRVGFVQATACGGLTIVMYSRRFFGGAGFNGGTGWLQ